MARASRHKFNEWIGNNDLPESVEKFLTETNYDTMDMLRYLDCNIIDKSPLSKQDKNKLKIALELENYASSNDEDNWTEPDMDSDDSSNETGRHRTESYDSSDEVETYQVESLKWKEFGLSKYFQKWKKSFYPVEIFCPDGFWAWNSTTKSLLFGNLNTSQVWNRFEDNKPGWIMSPPVLLPNAVGPFKISLSLRVIPKVLDDAPILQLVLLNDSYNKRLLKFFKIPKELSMVFKFINLSNGLEVGQPIHRKICFYALHDSHNIRIPGNILALKSPPVILVQVVIK